MTMTEQQLKVAIKIRQFSPVTVLYGEEPYAVWHYARQIFRAAVPSEDFAEFNCRVMDGDDFSLDDLEVAVQAIPLMGEHTCVWVREYNAGAANAAQTQRMETLLREVTEPCVLLFSVSEWSKERQRNIKWKAFLSAADKAGAVVSFPKYTSSQLVGMLCRRAAGCGCTLSREVAEQMVEQCGDDVRLLLSELQKLCALAEGGEITARMVASAAGHRIEASVYELSRALISRRYDAAYDCLSRLFACGEEPLRVLSVLSESYADLYRAKCAGQAGVRAETLAADFSCRGREFRLRNAARDCRALSVSALRESLDVLALADTRMKTGGLASDRILLDETVTRLIEIAGRG